VLFKKDGSNHGICQPATELYGSVMVAPIPTAGPLMAAMTDFRTLKDAQRHATAAIARRVRRSFGDQGERLISVCPAQITTIAQRTHQVAKARITLYLAR
jgi:hypothetical protein